MRDFASSHCFKLSILKKISFLSSLTLLITSLNLQKIEAAGCGECSCNDSVAWISEPPQRCTNLFVYGDYLYWRAAITGLPFATTGQLATDLLEFVNNEKIQNTRFSYDSGFRVGAGYQLDCGWDLKADWTHFYTSASTSIAANNPLTATDNNLIEAIWTFLPSRILNMNVHQSSKFDQVKVDLLKNLSLGSYFTLHPSFGPVGGWLKQNLTLHQSELMDDAPGMRTTTIKNNFAGGGLHVGLETEYTPFTCLSLYGKGSYSLLYGTYTLSRDIQENLTTGAGLLSLSQQQKTTEHAVANAFDIMAGLRTTWNICDYFDLTAHVSYEFVFWPHQVRVHQLSSINDNSSSLLLLGDGDVSFNGLTTGLTFSF